MDKPEKIKIGCCPICGGTIKRLNLRKLARLNQVRGFNIALGGINDTWGALIYNFSAELELSEEQTAKLSRIAEEYNKMMMGFLEEDMSPEDFADYIVEKSKECKARLEERWG